MNSVAKDSMRNGAYYSWRMGPFKTEQDFMEEFVKITGRTYEESYNQVMEVMRTIQEMLLTYKRFMLPGIGVIGLAENPKKGIVLASSALWWTPGLLNVIAGAKGWENAPLNTYLTESNIHTINTIVASAKGKQLKNLSPYQFYNASDFGGEGEMLSDEKMEFYKQAESKSWLAKRKRLTLVKNMRKAKKERDAFRIAKYKLKVRALEAQLKVLGELPADGIDVEAEVKAQFEKVLND